MSPKEQMLNPVTTSVEEGSSSIHSSPSADLFSWMQLSPGLGSSYIRLRELKSEDRGLWLFRLLEACTSHIASGRIKNADVELRCISQLASPDGDSVQRIASYFSEALSYRVIKHLPGVFSILDSTNKLSAADEHLVKKIFFDLCPFLKLAYVLTNQSIMEAMEGEEVVHIIDLNCFDPVQWIELLHRLREREGGPPHLKLTGIHKQKEVLDHMAGRLSKEAELLDIPFQFNPIVGKLESIDIDCLGVKTGEALAVSSVLELHNLLEMDDEMHTPKGQSNLQKAIHVHRRTLADWLEKDMMNAYLPSPDSALSPLSVSASPKMGSFLTGLRTLSPKRMVITEQESNVNVSNLMERVMEALHFYGALFDCLESTVSRTSAERQKVEKMLFAKEINNIITCEGVERKERHEMLEKWNLRLELAGFGRVPFSYHGMWLANRLLENYGNGYVIKEKSGSLVICWNDRPLYSVSAWGVRSY